MKPTLIVTDETITVVVQSTPYVIAVGQPRWGPLLEAITAEDWEAVIRITTEVDQLRASTLVQDGDLEVKDGRILWRGNQLSGYLIDHILRTIRDGEDAQPLLNFLKRLQRNPSHRVVQGLFRWLEKGDMKITPDGLIIAYKKVRADFTDAWSGTMDNSIGARPFKERNAIDDEPTKTCADSGLHFCSKGYLPNFQSYGSNDHIMVIHVDPEHVVSFPPNEEFKGRACTYEVVDMIPRGEDPDLYIRAGLRPGSNLVAEVTTAPPSTAVPEDDSIGAKAWAALPAHDSTTGLMKLADVEDHIGTDGPNLPARIRAAEKELGLKPVDPADWLSRIDDIWVSSEDLRDDPEG